MKEGRLVIDICEMPIKCPVAPLEFAFLADYYFRQKGIRDRIEISLVTPYTGAFTKPNANRVLSKVADDKGIKVVPELRHLGGRRRGEDDPHVRRPHGRLRPAVRDPAQPGPGGAGRLGPGRRRRATASPTRAR